jgi:hypothetical protein
LRSYQEEWWGQVTWYVFVRKEKQGRLWWGEQKEETSSKAHAYMKDERYNGCHGNRMKSMTWIRVLENREEDTGCGNDIE